MADPLITTAERELYRLQAGDLLTQCVVSADLAPVKEMVESLVLEGPDNLRLLRAVLEEAEQRKAQVENDLRQVISGFESNLVSLGIHLSIDAKPHSILRLKPGRFLNLLRSKGIVEQETHEMVLRLIHDVRDLVSSLGDHYALLAQIEAYLQDWNRAMLYELMRPQKPM